MDKKSNIRFDFIGFAEYWDESNSYPMGILYISACLKRSGFTNIGYIDHICMLRKMGERTGPLFNFRGPETQLESMSEERKNNFKCIFEYLKERQPQIIFLGPVTTFYLVELIDLVRRLREQCPEQLILAGGPHFGKEDSLDNEIIERCTGLDGLVIGEAEETVAEVAIWFYSEYCKSNRIPSRVEFLSKLAEIPGILIRGKRLKLRDPPRLESLPSPDMELLEKNFAHVRIRYSLSKRRNPITRRSRGIVESVYGDGVIEEDIPYFYPYVSWDYRFPFGVIIGSRGCPYRCGFCCSPGPRRLHSASFVFNQILDLNKRYGIRQFVFFDPLFATSNKVEQERVKELCKMICNSGLDIRYIIDIRADVILELSDELLALLMRSGCAEFNLGLEKGSDRMLQKMVKGMTIKDHHDAVTKLRRVAKSVKRNIIINGTFILGGPGETKGDIRETLIHCLLLNLDKFTLYPLEIYPGTQIYTEALKEGILKPGLAPFLNVEEYPLYETKNIPRSFLVDINKLGEQLLDEQDELKIAMQELERQFLPEDERGSYYVDIKRTENLHNLIEGFIGEGCDYLMKHPDEGLLRNGLIVPIIYAYIKKIDKEMDSVEEQLIQKYPNYDPYYWDYHPGTLSMTWKRFLKKFEELFSKERFLNE